MRDLKPSERADYVRRVNSKRLLARFTALRTGGIRYWLLPAQAAVRLICDHPSVRNRWTVDDLAGIGFETMVDELSRADYVMDSHAPKQRAKWLLLAMRHDMMNEDEKLRRKPEGNIDYSVRPQ
jgi:hypothetical protein